MTFWIMEMDERKLYNDFGCSNIFQYATHYLSLGEHTIAELLRTGKALAQLPLLSEAFEKGQISSSHIREISRVATKDTEEYWCDTARGKTVREVEKFVAFTPKGGLPGMKSAETKPVNSAAIQPAHSMTPAIPVESAIPSAPAPASKDLSNCTSAGETLHEPGIDTGMSQQVEQSNVPVISPQEQSATVEAPHQQRRGQLNIFEDKNINCPHPKYHEKLVVDLDALQMSVLQDAFTKARKESGLRDRASLLIHIAKAFLEGCPSSGKRRKPRYQIVLHRHLPSGLAWCDTLKGERPVSPEVLEKALCDAEIVQLDEPAPPTWEQNDEKETDSGVMKEDAGSKNNDILKEAHEYINEQYMKIKAARRKGHTKYKSIYKSIRKEGRAIAYGYCLPPIFVQWGSNKSRGMRKKQETSQELQVIEPVLYPKGHHRFTNLRFGISTSSKAYRKRWAQWIQKVWGTDPLLCSKCGGKMDIVSFIEDQAVIKKILVSMDLWEKSARPPPKSLLLDLDEYEITS